jgi:transposase
MEAMLTHCAGLDVHQATVVACALVGDLDVKPTQIVKTFGTTTNELLQLREWLASHQITHVAMESTGVYWVPVWNVLEGHFHQILGNAFLIKNVPGRKTDVKDAVWIAQLLRCGLIPASFVPPEAFRELRLHSRYRHKLTTAATAEKNRIQKTLETANIKLATFLTDVFGKSGRDLLQSLINGEVLDLQQVRDLVHTRVKAKAPELVQALNGNVKKYHRDMIRLHLEHLTFLEQRIAALDVRINTLLEPYQEQIELLDSIPGIDKLAAATIFAEIGPDPSIFPTDRHLSSWAGVCPGNNESAGKKKVHASLKASECSNLSFVNVLGLPHSPRIVAPKRFTTELLNGVARKKREWRSLTCSLD